MIEKEMDWPIAPGDYEVGDPKNPVAIVFFGAIKVKVPPEYYAIKGVCDTENIGIEKMIVNIISNPNIRYLILCGGEILGHFTRDCIKALHKNGIDGKGKIIGARGKIPYLVNIPTEAIDRFRDQLELIDLTHEREALKVVRSSNTIEEFSVDVDELIDAIKVCIAKKTGKYGEPMIIQTGPLQADGRELGRSIIDFSNKIFAQRVGLQVEKLTTKADLAWISPEFAVVLNPVLGDISISPFGMNFMKKLMDYYHIG
jgi:tetrahydromethanopterin S-methyltransferase subunit A